MAEPRYKIKELRITDKEFFKECSKEELRVLVALIERGCSDPGELSAAAGVSRSRALSTLTLLEAEGVAARLESTEKDNGEKAPLINVINEESKYRQNEIDETPAIEVAGSLRDENLAMTIEEVARIMGKATLATADVRYISELYTKLGLSPEYITTLAAYLGDGKNLTGHRLRGEAERLHSQDISTLEELERYIKEQGERVAAEIEIKRVLGIYNRNLTDTERSLFRKWTEEYLYSVEIIRLAFDKTVLGTGGSLSMPYMDKIIEGWHEAGCKTVSECIALSERKKPTPEEKPDRRRRSKTAPEKPRYGDFDTDEAFRAALSRSFTDENN